MRKSHKLYCFSPPVMMATLLIEFGLAVYTFFKYRQGLFGRVAATMLAALALFQLAEYQVCDSQDAVLWSRFGLSVITLLPVLGLYLISLISQRQHFLRLGYVVVTMFLLYFLFVPKETISSLCGGNYIIFSGPQALYQFYAAYYFGFLIFGIWESIEALNKVSHRALQAVLKWFVVGYLSFMLPMGLAYAIYPPARYAVASIMCGFAVTFAIILAFQIVPKYYKYSAKT
jgi:hypothetical protein